MALAVPCAAPDGGRCAEPSGSTALWQTYCKGRLIYALARMELHSVYRSSASLIHCSALPAAQ